MGCGFFCDKEKTNWSGSGYIDVAMKRDKTITQMLKEWGATPKKKWGARSGRAACPRSARSSRSIREEKGLPAPEARLARAANYRAEHPDPKGKGKRSASSCHSQPGGKGAASASGKSAGKGQKDDQRKCRYPGGSEARAAGYEGAPKKAPRTG